MAMKSVICSSSGAAGGRRGQRRARLAVRARGELARAVEPELGDVRALAVALVAALRLAERGVGPRHVEDVVDDLKQDAELGGEVAVVGCLGSVHSGYQQYALYRRADQPPRLQLVQAPQPVAAS